MKRLLSILGAISLIGTSTTSLIACNTPQEYTKEELDKLKAENKIKTNNNEIRDNLKWIVPQEKPFNEVDNKYYYVVWRGDKNDKWYLSKFNNNTKLEDGKEKNIDKLNNSILSLYFYMGASFSVLITYISSENIKIPWNSKNDYIKSVYRWNLDISEPDLILDENGNIKVNGEYKKRYEISFYFYLGFIVILTGLSLLLRIPNIFGLLISIVIFLSLPA